MNKSVSILGLGWLGMPLAQEFYSKDFEVLGSRRAEVEDVLFKTFVVDLADDQQNSNQKRTEYVAISNTCIGKFNKSMELCECFWHIKIVF